MSTGRPAETRLGHTGTNGLRVRDDTADMPIDADRFEADPEELDDGTPIGPGRVLSFLRSNPGRAFTAGEIQAELGSGPSFRSLETMTVSTALSGLEARGFVRRHMGYWALSETGIESTRRPRVVYEGPDGVRECTPSDLERESGWVTFTVAGDDGDVRRHVPRERVYAVEFE